MTRRPSESPALVALPLMLLMHSPSALATRLVPVPEKPVRVAERLVDRARYAFLMLAGGRAVDVSTDSQTHSWTRVLESGDRVSFGLGFTALRPFAITPGRPINLGVTHQPIRINRVSCSGKRDGVVVSGQAVGIGEADRAPPCSVANTAQVRHEFYVDGPVPLISAHHRWQPLEGLIREVILRPEEMGTFGAQGARWIDRILHNGSPVATLIVKRSVQKQRGWRLHPDQPRDPMLQATIEVQGQNAGGAEGGRYVDAFLARALDDLGRTEPGPVRVDLRGAPDPFALGIDVPPAAEVGSNAFPGIPAEGRPEVAASTVKKLR